MDALLEFIRARFARENSIAAEHVAQHVLDDAGIALG